MSGTKDTPTERESVEQDRDEALEDTFPASDPPSTGGSTGPDDVPPPQR